MQIYTFEALLLIFLILITACIIYCRDILSCNMVNQFLQKVADSLEVEGGDAGECEQL